MKKDVDVKMIIAGVTMTVSIIKLVIPLIAERLLTTDRDELIERFWDYQKKIVEHVRTREKNTPLTERISKSVAMILLARE